MQDKPFLQVSRFDRESATYTKVYTGYCKSCDKDNVIMVIQVTEEYDRATLPANPTICYTCFRKRVREHAIS